MAASGARFEFSINRSMKRSGLTPPIIAATLFMALAFAPNSAAQDTMAPAQAARAAKRADELLKRFDKNRDGKLDDDERADAKEIMLKDQVDQQMSRTPALPPGLEPFRAQALEMFDRNRDGRLDEEERNAAHKYAVARQDGANDTDDLKKRFDRNSDGNLDADERTTIERFLTELRALGSPQIRSELLRQFDQNSDGKIDDNEFVELEKFVRPRVEASPTQVRRHDTNRDGKLDDAEWLAARGAIAQWLNSSGPAALESESMRPNDPAMLQRIADEVARRKAQRAGAPEGIQASMDPKHRIEAEQARLEAVAAEVARRRAERAAAQNKNAPLI